MDAETVAEIANQLGIAANSVGQLVTDLLPQFVTYWGIKVAKACLMKSVFVVLMAALIYVVMRFATEDCYGYDDDEHDDMVKKVNKWFVVITLVAIVIVIGYHVLEFVQVVAAPQMAIVNYILGK